MPIYEYECLKCGNKFSLLQSLSAAGSDTECPKCSSKKVKKIISNFSCSCESSSSSSPGFGGGGG